ncbi:ABC transporter permease [Spiroplasma sp. DGKH1]|uniref:ABC transporter permease n=1 Tax=Spiroplasma sp. DGKH1 TaxID=3050074 RepID=UPI0034C61B5D
MKTFHLIWRYQNKSILLWFLVFVLPVIFLVIMTQLASLMNSQVAGKAAFIVLPGIILSIGPTIGLINLAITIAELRVTKFYKHLAVLMVNVKDFIVSLILYNLLISIISSMWIMGFGFLVYNSQINFSWINWFYVFIAVVLNSILACLIGFCLGIAFNNFKVTVLLAGIIFLLAVFLSGLYLPLLVIKASHYLKYFSYCLPFTYPMGVMILGWYNFVPLYNHHPIVDQGTYNLFDSLTVPLVISCSWILVFALIIYLISKVKKWI